jgi:hypothetical protein
VQYPSQHDQTAHPKYEHESADYHSFLDGIERTTKTDGASI